MTNPYSPGAYPHPYPPQAQQPTQPAYPPSPGYAPAPAYPPSPPGYAPPAPAPAAPAPAPGAAPGGWYMPDAALVESSYRRAAERQEQVARARGGEGSRGSLVFFKIPGPQGQDKWDASVPVGYESSRPFRLLPAWKDGALHFLEANKHFWKSQQHPGGTGAWCPGEDQCPICQGRKRAIESGAEARVRAAREWGRAKTHFLYQGFALDDLRSHIDEQGQIVPQILDAGQVLHGAIIEIQKTRGFAQIFHPHYGRPLQIKKRKTGTQNLDIEYHVIDLDPAPIPAEFRPEALNLIDLSRIVKVPTIAELQAAAIEIGLEVPQVYSYAPNPSPPAPNPYAPTYAPQPPAYAGTQLPAVGPPPQPVPLPAAPVGAPPVGYAPQPSRVAPPVPPGPPLAAPPSAAYAPPPVPPPVPTVSQALGPVSGHQGPPGPPPAGAAAPPSYVNPQLAALEAQLRGDAPGEKVPF